MYKEIGWRAYNKTWNNNKLVMQQEAKSKPTNLAKG